MKLIPNENLVLEKIPNPDDKSFDYQEPWIEFALTMNAYEVCGDFKAASVTSFPVRVKAATKVPDWYRSPKAQPSNSG